MADSDITSLYLEKRNGIWVVVTSDATRRLDCQTQLNLIFVCVCVIYFVCVFGIKTKWSPLFARNYPGWLHLFTCQQLSSLDFHLRWLRGKLRHQTSLLRSQHYLIVTSGQCFRFLCVPSSNQISNFHLIRMAVIFHLPANWVCWSFICQFTFVCQFISAITAATKYAVLTMQIGS